VEDPPHGGEVLADIEVCGDRRPSRRGSGNEPDEAIVELVRVARRRHPDLAAAALYWRHKTDAFFHYQHLGLPVIGIRYEALVSRPEAVLRGVVGHLGLDWDPAVMAHERSDHPQISKAGLATGGTDPTRAIDDRSVGQWREFIEPSAVDEMLAIAAGLDERVAAL